MPGSCKIYPACGHGLGLESSSVILLGCMFYTRYICFPYHTKKAAVQRRIAQGNHVLRQKELAAAQPLHEKSAVSFRRSARVPESGTSTQDYFSGECIVFSPLPTLHHITFIFLILLNFYFPLDNFVQMYLCFLPDPIS